MGELRTPWYETYRRGFFIAKSAEGISPETVKDYSRSFGYFGE
jgi:hypothetical protein